MLSVVFRWFNWVAEPPLFFLNSRKPPSSRWLILLNIQLLAGDQNAKNFIGKYWFPKICSVNESTQTSSNDDGSVLGKLLNLEWLSVKWLEKHGFETVCKSSPIVSCFRISLPVPSWKIAGCLSQTPSGDPGLFWNYLAPWRFRLLSRSCGVKKMCIYHL